MRSYRHKTLSFKVTRQSLARKFWSADDNSNRKLLCFSSNGIFSKTGKLCCQCENIRQCMLKLRIFFYHDNLSFCIELPLSAYDNYRKYTGKLAEYGLDVKDVTTIAEVIDMGYWGNVFFFSDSLADRDVYLKDIYSS